MAESEEDYGDDDYSQVNDYNYQNRMPNNYQHTMTKAELRRSTKPIMEKRRRARINRCLNELKSLILDALKKDPARHSKLEKADILEMTVKHLQNVQKRQLSSAMMADPAVIHKFRGGFEECATEVGRYIEGLDGIDAGVRRRLAAHLSSCVTNIPRNDNINNADTNNNSARLNAVSASLRLIPSRLPNGELALLVPDAQSLPNNVLPFFQLAEHTQMAPNLRHQSFNQVSTTTDKLPDTLRLDTSPSHPSAFTAVNKHANAERTPSPTTSVSSSVDRNASSAINNMSSEVSSTSEQPAESSTDPSSLNSSTSSLSPQNLVRNPEPLTISTKCSPNNYQNHSASSLSPQNFARNPQGCSPGYQSGNVSSQPSYLQRNNPSQHVSSGSHLKNALQSPPTAKQYQNGSKNVEDVGYNLSQKHQTLEAHPKFLYSENSKKSFEENLSQKHQTEEGYPKFVYPDFPKTTTDQGERFGSRVSQGCYTYMDAIKSQEPFPATKEQQEILGKRHLDMKSSEFSSPLTVETNLDSVQRFPVGKFLVESVGNTLPAPIDFSKNVDYQNYFVPSLKRRRLEAASSEKGSSKSADFGEKQSFSPRIIILEEKSGNTANDDQEVEAPRNNGSEASTSDNMWRPW